MKCLMSCEHTKEAKDDVDDVFSYRCYYISHQDSLSSLCLGNLRKLVEDVVCGSDILKAQFSS